MSTKPEQEQIFLCVGDPVKPLNKNSVPMFHGAEIRPMFFAPKYIDALEESMRFTSENGCPMIVYEVRPVATSRREAVVREILHGK